MFRSHHLSPTCFVIGALALVPVILAAATSPEKEASNKIVDLGPFTRVTYIPVGADLSSISFEGIHAVKVATKERSVTNLHYCDERLTTEPGGSMYCPLITLESAVPAYKVAYTFTAPPMASDEYGNTSFTFSVYFSPDDISPSLREALLSGKVSRAEASRYFRISASRNSARQVMVDEAKSTFCEGDYIDGNWSHTNPTCQDHIVYKNVASASPYLTVKVDVRV
ncbi:MAG TPA: hypothetical protein VHZ55_34355 [Bryobacteraceae bacterium]|nr:hypothetical protein [Bryobacteraceae bacterium]